MLSVYVVFCLGFLAVNWNEKLDWGYFCNISSFLMQSALEVYKEMVLLYIEEARHFVNSQCAGLEPWQIIATTLLSTLGAVWLKGLLFQQESKCY